MNVIMTPVNAQGGPVQKSASQGESDLFATVLDEKCAQTQPAADLAAGLPEMAEVLPGAIDNALNPEEGGADLPVTLESMAVPVLPPLMVQIAENAQPQISGAAGEIAAEGEALTFMPGDGQGQPGDSRLRLDAAFAVKGSAPTAAAQASLKIMENDKSDASRGQISADIPMKAADAASNRMAPALAMGEARAELPPVQEGQPTLPVSVGQATSSAATPAQTATTVPAPVPGAMISQELGTEAWRQSLNEQISLFTRNGVQNAELRLNPQELGVIRINMQLNSDRAVLHFVSEHHQVRSALEAAMPQLRSALAETGIQLGESSVGAESFSSWNEHTQSERVASRPGGEEDGADANAGQTEAEAEPAVRHISLRSNGINTFA